MTLSLADAERIVEGKLRDLERDFQPKDLAIDRDHIKEYEWGWLVPYGERRWIERRDSGGIILGAGPFLVDRESGATDVMTSGGGSAGAQIRRFERRIGFRPWWKIW
jgi:hypothetical protein